jgi:hypothetical protein
MPQRRGVHVTGIAPIVPFPATSPLPVLGQLLCPPSRVDVAAALVAGVLDWQSLVVFHRAPSSVDVPEPTGAHDSARE